jgi:hypothetical protein
MLPKYIIGTGSKLPLAIVEIAGQRSGGLSSFKDFATYSLVSDRLIAADLRATNPGQQSRAGLLGLGSQELVEAISICRPAMEGDVIGAHSRRIDAHYVG